MDVGPDTEYQWPEGMWITRREAKVIDKLVKKTGGPCLELGSCEGHTTWFLAKNNMDVKIVAVDWDGKWKPWSGGRELAYADRDGGFENVESLCMDTDRVDLAGIKPRFVLIDGNSTYEGVRRDTENVLAYRAAYDPGLVVVWHDLHPEGLGQHWAGVSRFLRELSYKLPLQHVEKTCLAVLNVGNDGMMEKLS